MFIFYYSKHNVLRMVCMYDSLPEQICDFYESII